MAINYCTTDLLIIGGGSAGTMAAIRAKELDPDIDVVIVEKAHVKRSGSITMGMDALNVMVLPDRNRPEDYVETCREACEGILDTGPSYTLAQRSYDLLKKLESWGVFFPKNDQGDYQTMQVHLKGKFCVAMDEPDLKVMLWKKADESGSRILNRMMAVSLLKRDQVVTGAVCLDIKTGDLLVCQAKAVILANGGAGRFGLPASGYLYGTYDYPGNAGDGYALAFYAGAKLTGMEYITNNTLIKDVNLPLLYITLTRGAKLVNVFGEVIASGGVSVSTGKRLAEYFRAGPLFIKMDHLPEEKIQEIEHILFTTERPIQRRFWQRRGVNFRKDPIELAPTEAQICGGHGISGLVVNEKAETTVDGLYAAGDVAAVPMQHLTGALVFGQVAAESGLQFMQQNFFKNHLPAKEVEQISHDLARFWDNSKAEVDIYEFEYKVRRIINDYVLSPKNHYKLTRAVEWMQQLRQELPEIVSINNPHQLARALEVQFIIDCAFFSAVAAMTRQESRWGHHHWRNDYPKKDDANWLKHIDLSVDGGPLQVKISYRQIQR